MINTFPHMTIMQQMTLNLFKSEKPCVKRRNFCIEQFLLLSHYVFKKPSAAEASGSVYVRERVNNASCDHTMDHGDKYGDRYILKK